MTTPNEINLGELELPENINKSGALILFKQHLANICDNIDSMKIKKRAMDSSDLAYNAGLQEAIKIIKGGGNKQ